MIPTVVIVGLGPGGDDLVTSGTLAAIAAAPAVFARTERHPAASVLTGATFFDDVYDAADTMDEVYTTIVERLVEAATVTDRVVYAVPGSPLVAERTVQLLLDDARVATEVVPALSFLDLAWTRLGIDPIATGVRVVDGHRFTVDAAGQRGPLLVAQCDSALVLSDVKLSIEEWPSEPVTVIQRLGLPDERIFEVEWADLDRGVEADHLTSIYIPTLEQPVAAELVQFDELVHALRTGCPWDREQTHESLKRYLLEECYELLEAIDGLAADTDESIDALQEELGDVLFQVFFHATIAAESGWFTLADVARTVHDKLRDRHPHVFGSATFESAEALAANWEAQKKTEKRLDAGYEHGAPLRALAMFQLRSPAIVGGDVKGPKLNGTVVPHSGGDYPMYWPNGAVEFTLTVSVAAPNSSCISSRADWFTCSEIPVRSAFLKPEASTITW